MEAIVALDAAQRSASAPEVRELRRARPRGDRREGGAWLRGDASSLPFLGDPTRAIPEVEAD